VAIVSVNLPDDLLARLDRAVAELGYRSRSQLVRDALEEKLGAEGGGSVRVLLVASDHSAQPGVDQRVVAAAYTAGGDLIGLYHVVVGGSRCVTVILLREGERAAAVARRVRRVRGVVRVVSLTL